MPIQRTSQLISLILKKKKRISRWLIRVTKYVWTHRNNRAFWESVREQIQKGLSANYNRIVIDGLIPPLCVYLKYVKITVTVIVILSVIVYSIRYVLQPMLIVIHDKLSKIADFLDKIASWLSENYPYIGLILVSGMGLEVLTICLQNPQIWNLLQSTIAQMSSGPQIALRLLASTALGDGLLKLLQSTAWAWGWGGRLLVPTWYQKLGKILAIGLRLPALQTLGSVLETTLQLVGSISPRALAEVLVRFVWIQRPWYQKPAMLAIGLQITSLNIRGLMGLCILTHNKLYYPYAWLANPARWILTTRVSVFSWISKAYERR